MRRALLQRLRRLGGDERGASIIEFALFAPILAVMVMGVSDVAMSYATKLRFEQAAYTALEKVAVGSVQTDYSFLREDAATAADVSEEEVTVDAWLECEGERATSFTDSCEEGDTITRYVQVTIDSGYTPTFAYGPLTAATRDDGTIPVTASAAVRIQ